MVEIEFCTECFDLECEDPEACAEVHETYEEEE